MSAESFFFIGKDVTKFFKIVTKMQFILNCVIC